MTDEMKEMEKNFKIDGIVLSDNKPTDLLFKAIINNDIEFVKLLLPGADLREKGMFSRTALDWVVCKGNMDILELILKYKDCINLQNKFGNDALRVALNEGYLKVANRLLDCKEIDVNVGWVGMTALHWAAFRGHTAVVNRLLKAGINRNIKDDDGKTALMIAKEWGMREEGRLDEMIKLLENDSSIEDT